MRCDRRQVKIVPEGTPGGGGGHSALECGAREADVSITSDDGMHALGLYPPHVSGRTEYAAPSPVPFRRASDAACGPIPLDVVEVYGPST